MVLGVTLAAFIVRGLGMSVIVVSYFTPPLLKAGYRREDAALLIASGTAMGMLVPPAIFMIILGEVTNTSVHVLIIQLAELQNAATGDTGCRQRNTGIWLPLA